MVVNTGAQTCTVSSARFKNSIDTLNLGLDDLKKLNPVSFKYNGSDEERIGFIAEEVRDIDGRLIFTETDGTTPRGVRYEEMVALVVKAVQELSALISSISTKVSIIYTWFDGGVFTAQGDICVDDICVTKDQFKALLIQSGGVVRIASSTNEISQDSSDTQDNTPDNLPGDEQSATTTDTILDEIATTTTDIVQDDIATSTETVNTDEVVDDAGQTDTTADTPTEVTSDEVVETTGDSESVPDSNSDSEVTITDSAIEPAESLPDQSSVGLDTTPVADPVTAEPTL
jgi:hypothetical protein